MAVERLCVERLAAHLVELPFRFRFGHALASRDHSLNLIVVVQLTDGSVGYGEGIPREYVTGETPDGVFTRVTEEYGPALLARELPARSVASGLRALRDELHAGRPAPGAAWCAVETALLDAIGRATGRSAADLLGGAVRTGVRYGAVAPFASGPMLAAMLLFFRLYGFQDVKLKLGRGAAQDVATVRLARQILGSAVELRADANCAWGADMALAMAARLRPFGVESYEQPVGARDLPGLARLSAELPEDVVVDESLCSPADARRLIAAKACSAFNVRVSKCGGPLAALQLVELAHRAGLVCQLGAQVGESGILTAAGRLVATVTEPGFRHHEGADNRFLLRRDLTVEDLTVRPGGRGDGLTDPGLGVRVRRDALHHLSRRQTVVDAPDVVSDRFTITGRRTMMDIRKATTTTVLSQLWRWFSDARRFEGSTYDAVGAQRAKLLSIVRANRDTAYGRTHGFGSIEDVDDFQRNVPINTHESLTPYIDQIAAGKPNVLTAEAPLMFALTSGTTGKAKLIPVTPSSMAEYNHAVQTHTWRVLEEHPEAGSGLFMVTSSRDVEGRTSAGIPYGAMSGLVVKRQPALVRSRFALPYEISLITNVELKYYLTLRMALSSDVSALSSLNPSTILLLCQKLQQYAEPLIRDVKYGTASALGPLPEWLDRVLAWRLTPNPRRADELAAYLRNDGVLHPTEVWPNLAFVTCWKGGTMPLYFRQLQRWFPGLPIRDRGYMASEGCGSIPLTDAGCAGALAITTSFFEFIPVEARDQASPPVLTCAELQPNRDYYVLFTTSAGLYRYDINDVIRVVDFYHDVPLIEFVRKGRGMTSLTGEKLAEQQVTSAMLAAVDGLGSDEAIRHFAAVPVFGSPPRYAVFLELGEPIGDAQLRQLAERLDCALCDANVEYETKRESLRLGSPLLRIVAPGTFDAYRQERVSGGAPEAQVKVPHLSPDRDFGRQFTVIREIEQAAS